MITFTASPGVPDPRNTELEEENERRDEMTFEFLFEFGNVEPDRFSTICREVERIHDRFNTCGSEEVIGLP